MPPDNEQTEPAFSPSINHQRLREAIVPSQAYEGGSVCSWQQRLRPRIRELLGIPAVDRPPLNERLLWSEQTTLGRIDKLVFTAEEGADVPAYFCVPDGVQPPYRTVICLQGHSTGMHNSIGRQRDDESEPLEVEGDRDFALSAMRNGFAALCIEQRAFGYRREQLQDKTSPHGCHDAAMQALMLGRTLAGERVFDVDRGLDYLEARGDIDMDRVGVMGNSGGGTVSIYAAAVLERIHFVMPSCSFCSFAESIMTIYHCADNYIPGLLREAEASDVLGLFAPKPVVVVAGADDPIFPISGVRPEFNKLRRIYDDTGAGDQCRLVIGDGGHRFYAAPAWQQLSALLA